MSWQSYVDTLIGDGFICQDAAVVGYEMDKSVWASYCPSSFATITPEQIDMLLSENRESLLIHGVTLGNVKCSVLRDSFDVDGDWTMDLRTKDAGGGPTYNITIAKSLKAFVVVMGKGGVHGGKPHIKAQDMASYLRKAGY
ncbi:profilin-1-like [Phycodurus eques]|uniref:profilin-1-like n=1 Tax=Phycodurus eques TaxID=693459 RepID=UPI002ACDF5C4|nr:profilin-1-like [Phycodurus eques]XP_061540814.1 profilin-1-like [Phycodurus eques]XP_061540815.1 profilin-1-like [Phycodurus eques]